MKRRAFIAERIFLAILSCTIAERAIAQVYFDFERPPLEGAIVRAPPEGARSFAGPQHRDTFPFAISTDEYQAPRLLKDQCAGLPALSELAPSIASKKPVPPASVLEVLEVTVIPLSVLQNAAEDGNPIAQWKLGRMYAEGNGVAQNDLLAFEYFSRIVNAHGEDSPTSPLAPIVDNAYVSLARYYLKGIPNSNVKADPDRARELFEHAASYFGNADAQYYLARLYLKDLKATNVTPNDLIFGARWLGLAAEGATPGAGLARADTVQR